MLGAEHPAPGLSEQVVAVPDAECVTRLSSSSTKSSTVQKSAPRVGQVGDWPLPSWS